MTSIIITDEDINQISSSMCLAFDDEHIRILKSLDSIDVQACPGSGKTTLIAAKLIILSQKLDFKKDAICVLSHTNVAKYEIIKRIEQSNNERALKLLAYPNFIGTIHEFVNKFIGVPYLRSLDRQIKIIDDEITATKITQLIPTTILSEFKVLEDKKCYSFKVNKVTGKDRYEANFPKQRDSSSFTSEDFTKELRAAKKKIFNDGYYFHDEMFVFGNAYLNQNDSLIKMLKDRFKYIFLDEMQDSSKVQEDLINRLFNENNNVIQRFGDVDQILFASMSTLNDSYNNQKNFFSRINTSNRFHSQIAMVAKNLSFSGINLCSRDSVDVIKPCLMVFQSSTDVLQNFTNLVKSEVVERRKIELPHVKALGWVTDKGIKKYFAEFSPEHDKRKYRPNKFITSFWLARQMINDGCDLNIPYQYIINSIVRLVKFVNDEVYNTESLFMFIEKINKTSEFKKCIFDIFSQIEAITGDLYNGIICNILDSLLIDSSINDNEDFIEYVLYQDCINIITTNQKTIDGISIDFSTIHGAKGETHDATLILESSYWGNYDIKLMLPWILGQEVDRCNLSKELGNYKNHSASIEHMRLLYVAMTRPKYLLCMAINKQNITDGQIQLFKDQGWSIKQC